MSQPSRAPWYWLRGLGPRLDRLDIQRHDLAVLGTADGVDGDDVDALVNEIVVANNAGVFDISGDGVVDGDDLDQWLADAATANGFAAPYLLGDANLDGEFNSSDLVAVFQARRYELDVDAGWAAACLSTRRPG